MDRTAAINKLEEGLTELFEKSYRDIPVYIESKPRWEENLETECVVADRKKLKNGNFEIRFWGKGEDLYFTLDDIAKDKSITNIFYPKFLYNEYVKVVFSEGEN